MKKLLFILALAAICGGCKKPKEEYIGMRPVSAPDDVVAFFDQYLPESNDSAPPHEFDFGDVSDDDTVCLMINNDGEFIAIAPPSAELPDIDFVRYTLVIGQHSMGDPGYELKKQGVEVGSNETTLNLVYKRSEGGHPTIPVSFYFWGLYSKLPNKPVRINVIKK